MSNTVVLPEPKIRTPHSFHEPGRSRHVDYLVREDDVERVIVRILVLHFKDRKVFTASANRIVQEKAPRNGFSTERSWPLDAVRIAQEPVGRFSAKAIEAFTAKVVAAFPALVAEHESLAAKFAEHAERDKD